MNNTEYCQGIYEAASKIADMYQAENRGLYETDCVYASRLDDAVANLKRALEGKESKP